VGARFLVGSPFLPGGLGGVGRDCYKSFEFVHFAFTARPQLITALSEGRGYGEAGGEGLFSSCMSSESLTHRFTVPPLPQAGEGCYQRIFRGQT
jgi:hypothetical protein